MIRPPGVEGVVFTEARDGDQRNDAAARGLVSEAAGIDSNWATVTQVHGNRVLRVGTHGRAGEADALWTDRSGLPLAVFTADCFGVVMQAPGAIGVAHAGWRGVLAGVVESLGQAMGEAGHVPTTAVVGPGIGACCYEVGPEVAGRFGDHLGITRWNSRSVDLVGALEERLSVIDHASVDSCTFHEPGWFSHRRDRTVARLATIAWLT